MNIPQQIDGIYLDDSNTPTFPCEAHYVGFFTHQACVCACSSCAVLSDVGELADNKAKEFFVQSHTAYVVSTIDENSMTCNIKNHAQRRRPMSRAPITNTTVILVRDLETRLDFFVSPNEELLCDFETKAFPVHNESNLFLLYAKTDSYKSKVKPVVNETSLSNTSAATKLSKFDLDFHRYDTAHF